MAIVVDKADLERAFEDSIAVSKEFDGAPIEEKLAAQGLDAQDVASVLGERYRAYLPLFDPDAPEVFFVQAMLEGLLAGKRLR